LCGPPAQARSSQVPRGPGSAVRAANTTGQRRAAHSCPADRPVPFGLEPVASTGDSLPGRASTIGRPVAEFRASTLPSMRSATRSTFPPAARCARYHSRMIQTARSESAMVAAGPNPLTLHSAAKTDILNRGRLVSGSRPSARLANVSPSGINKWCCTLPSRHPTPRRRRPLRGGSRPSIDENSATEPDHPELTCIKNEVGSSSVTTLPGRSRPSGPQVFVPSGTIDRAEAGNTGARLRRTPTG